MVVYRMFHTRWKGGFHQFHTDNVRILFQKLHGNQAMNNNYEHILHEIEFMWHYTNKIKERNILTR